MNTMNYESPEIQTISMEPDESLMVGDFDGLGGGAPGTSTGTGEAPFV